MKIISPNSRSGILLIAIVLSALFSIGQAQNPSLKVFEEWRDTAGTQNTFYKASTITIPGTTQILVCGATLNNNGDYDMLVEKIDGTGTVLWTQQYDGPGHGDDIAADVQVNPTNGDVYVTGSYYEDATDSNNAVTIKYGSNGVLHWIATYNGTGSKFDATIAMLVDDANGDVYCAGLEWSGANLYDMLLIKYDKFGVQQWVNTLDYANGNDGLNKIGMNIGKPYAGGGVQDVLSSYQYAVCGFDLSGSGISAGGFSVGTTPGFNRLADMVVDDTGNVYITGFVFNLATMYDIRTIKLDSNLSVVWSLDYDAGYNMDDEGTGLALDSHNNVIVVGYSETVFNGKNYTIIKYNNAGALQWIRDYDDPDFGDDSASAIVIGKNDTDAIYVTGYSFNGSTNDYWTMRLDGQGNRVWGIAMNSILNGDDKATAIALDSLGDIIISGQNKLADTVFAYTTVKYIEKNMTLPQDTISTTSTSFVFTENRGQIWGNDSAQHPEVKFYTIYGSPKVYFMDTAVSYVFARLDSTPTPDTLVRVDMKFKNANANLKIRPMDQRTEVNNFYYDYIPGGREQVHNYDQLISFNVWNNVDMVYGSNLKGLKYYFVCKPGGGGNPATQIDLLYQGADSVKIDGSGQLIIYTKLGTVIQPKASAWQLDASGNFSPLGWQPNYTLLGTNEVGFAGFGAFNTAYPLIIGVDWGDIFPTSILNLDWSTYYGGDAREDITDVDVYQPNGSTHYTGWTLSSTFPTQSAYQTGNSGGFDAVAIKCDSAGVRQYATYYGTGTTSSPTGQWGQSGALDANGNFFIGGRAAYFMATITFPTQPPGSYMDMTYNGGLLDAFFAAFNNTGQLFWATYYGGSGSGTSEGVNDMLFDSGGNLYAVMTADTFTPVFNKPGAFNDTSNRGGMILKFDTLLALKWATMFSTKSGNVAALAFDPAGNLIVSGVAADTTLPVKNPGGGAYMDSSLTGTQDTYIARFNTADSLTWCTYFGGTGAETGTGIEVINGEIYLTGSTSSTTLFPFLYAGSGTYIDSTYNGGSKDLYVSQFKSNGQLIWSTYLGGSGTDNPGNIDADINGNFFVTGTTYSSDFPTVNAPNMYYDNSWGGNAKSDAVLVAFDAFRAITWATYFGGLDNENTSQGLDVFDDLRLYTCGWTDTRQSVSPPFPTQNLGGGAYWQPNMNSSALTNGFISRFTLTPLFSVGIADTLTPPGYGNSNLVVYPNPNGGEFQVLINSDSKNRQIEVYDVFGQLVSTVIVPDGGQSQSVSLNLSEQATGVYFIVLKDENGMTSQKVIKQ